DVRINAGDGTKRFFMGEVIPENPKPRETEIARVGGKVPAVRFSGNELQQLVVALFGNDQQRSAGLYFFIDWTHTVPAPWFDAFDHRVVKNDGDVALIDVELGAALRFELLFRKIMRNEGEVFAWDAIPLGRIAVTPVGKTDASHTAGDNDNIAADFLAEILLKN